MRVMKSEEVLAESPKSFEDAIKNAVDRFSKTVRGLASCYVNEMSTTIRDGQIDMYRVNLQMTFEVDAIPEKSSGTKKKSK
jgi:flavin-binding protein dodecin